MNSQIIFSTEDEKYMAEAIALAKLGNGKVAPNPLVGCVIVYNQQIIGKGYHEKYGEAHAEVNAINCVKDKELLKNATLYVTLEPCSHHGKTPPCCDLLIFHQVKRVVIGSPDPFPLVNGQGIQRMKEAGIEVILGVLQKECDFMNRRFLTFHQKKRPYIILKWAETADGFIDIDRADKKERKINWISNATSQKMVHQWRSEESGILVGWKTVLNDNPRLNVRLVEGKNPIRIILDAKLQSPLSSHIYDQEQSTIIYNEIKDELRNNLHIIRLKTLNFANVLKSLYEQQVQSILIEGGLFTLEQILQENTWDEVRRIRSNTKFYTGLKSPQLNVIPCHTISVEDDILDFYYNNKEWQT